MNKEQLTETLTSKGWGGHGVINPEAETPERGWTNTIKGVYHHLRYEEEGDEVLFLIHEVVFPEHEEDFFSTGRFSSVEVIKSLEEVRNLGSYDGVKVTQ